MLRQLDRLAARTPVGLARTGAYASSGSGDWAIAFSTHAALRVGHDRRGIRSVPALADDDLSPLLLAVVEATEEAVLNSLLAARTVTGEGGRTVEAIPVADVTRIPDRHALRGKP